MSYLVDQHMQCQANKSCKKLNYPKNQQLQKSNKSEKDKVVTKNNEEQKVESPKQKIKSPSSRPNSAPSSKKPPHRSFSNSSKKTWKDRLG